MIDRDAKSPEIYALSSGKYRLRRRGAGGWITSPATGVRFRREPQGRLAVQMGDHEGTRQVMPRR